jgi:hypothetical protein
MTLPFTHQNRDKFSRIVERNAIDELIFECRDGFSNAYNPTYVIRNNQRNLRIQSSFDNPL